MKRLQGIQQARAGYFIQQRAEGMENGTRIQTVDVCESKFQSIPLCAVDAPTSTLQTGNSLSKDGVHEA
jgi:hypothetical protein